MAESFPDFSAVELEKTLRQHYPDAFVGVSSQVFQQSLEGRDPDDLIRNGIDLPNGERFKFHAVAEVGDDKEQIAARFSKLEARTVGTKRDLPKNCWVCQATSGVKACAVCGCRYYCSKDHQRQHWRGGAAIGCHKDECERLRRLNTHECKWCQRHVRATAETVRLVKTRDVPDTLRTVCSACFGKLENCVESNIVLCKDS